MTKVYNKLVRDKIPEIIKRQDSEIVWSKVGDDIRRRESNIDVKYRILDDEELKKAAIAKLIEEAQELGSAKSTDDAVDELADIYEVFQLLLNIYRPEDTSAWGFEGVVSRRAASKAVDKGRFDRRIFLEEVSITHKFFQHQGGYEC